MLKEWSQSISFRSKNPGLICTSNNSTNCKKSQHQNQFSFGTTDSTFHTTKSPKRICLNKVSPQEDIIYRTNNNYNQPRQQKSATIQFERYSEKRKPANSRKQNSSMSLTKNNSLQDIKKQNMKSFLSSIDKNKAITICNSPAKNTRSSNSSFKYTTNNQTGTIDHIQNLEEMIESIKNKGFNKYQQEYEEKVKRKAKLEASVESLKKKISLNENNKKYVTKENARDRLYIQNWTAVADRHKGIAMSINEYKMDIPKFAPQIERLKKETMIVNAMILEEKSNVNWLRDQIQKMNWRIECLEKEKDNFRPALMLWNKHIQATQAKIKQLDEQKSVFMLNVNSFALKGYQC